MLTGDSFFHLAAYGDALPGLNLCGAGRVVCLIDPVGDVYACPFAIHADSSPATCETPGGFATSGGPRDCSPRCGARDRRRLPVLLGSTSCRGGCMAAKFFTGLPLDGPDPECVKGHGAHALSTVDAAAAPRPSGDHSHRLLPLAIKQRPMCDESPLELIGRGQ